MLLNKQLLCVVYLYYIRLGQVKLGYDTIFNVCLGCDIVRLS